jgi:peptidylprolyl isomerase
MISKNAFKHAIQIFSVAVVVGGAAPAPPTMQDILAQAPKSDWQAVAPSNLLVMQLAAGRVLIALAPDFAPNTIANIRTLVREHYFDGSFILRAQDNYVVQWARADKRAVPGAQNDTRSLGAAKATIKAEFDRPIGPDLSFTKLADPDTYAPETGFSNGFAVARDPREERTWLTHCYGMVGVGRDVAADSGSGQELYAVIGQSPRNLDRNVTLVGRVVQGMELLSSMPRGTGPLGFYQNQEKPVAIASIRLASELPAAQRPNVSVLRTDSATFARLIEERRTRRDAWYKHSPGHVGVCNVPLPTVVK